LAAVAQVLEAAEVDAEQLLVVPSNDGWTVRTWLGAQTSGVLVTMDPDYVHAVGPDDDGRIGVTQLHP
jgi:hypothetical protein